MSIKVLIVDDSSFFRKRLAEMIEHDPDLEIAGFAENGKEAIALNLTLRPDVITMDVEMPIMNGIEAVQAIMRSAHPTAILIFSSLSIEGAQSTLDALGAGAADFLQKNFEQIARRKEDAIATIVGKIKELGKCRGYYTRKYVAKNLMPSVLSSRISTTSTHATVAHSTVSAHNPVMQRTASVTPSSIHTTNSLRSDPELMRNSNIMSPNFNDGVVELERIKHVGSYKLLVIGSSTGGPVAVQTVLAKLPRNFPIPVLVVQHMPEAFTGAFAERLDMHCAMHVVEAKQGELLQPGTAYIAPGAHQMLILNNRLGESTIQITPSPEQLIYRPSVDVTLASCARVYKNSVLAVILTGMGYDGKQGSSLLKRAGSTIWAQNEESCVIYGMPKAVVEAKIASKTLPLERIADHIIKEVMFHKSS